MMKAANGFLAFNILISKIHIFINPAQANEGVCMGKVCLSIIFNHKYNKNIPLLQELYGKRFSSIYYIVPFFNETMDDTYKSRIISVYESSYCFQGYIAQAYDRIKNKQFSHYIFIGDDQILNPRLNENNILDEMGLSEQDSYIKEIIPYDETGSGSLVDQSNKLFYILSAFKINVGVSYLTEIPSYDEAAARCKKHNLRVAKSLPVSFFMNKGYIHPKHLPLTLNTLGINKGRKLYYPLFKAYSDMVIINEGSFKEFSRLSGIFAAMNIFVETAIPLAMVLACESIKYEKDMKKLYGVEWWGDQISQFEASYNADLDRLLQNFDDCILYYHPIKLSKWKRSK